MGFVLILKSCGHYDFFGIWDFVLFFLKGITSTSYGFLTIKQSNITDIKFSFGEEVYIIK